MPRDVAPSAAVLSNLSVTLTRPCGSGAPLAGGSGDGPVESLSECWLGSRRSGLLRLDPERRHELLRGLDSFAQAFVAGVLRRELLGVAHIPA